MKFSIKAGKLQPNTAAAALFVCTDACPCGQNGVDEVVAALCAQTAADEQRFVGSQVWHNGSLQALAVLRLQDTDYAAVQKAVAEAAVWAAKQPQLAVDVSALDAAAAATVVEVLTIALAQAVYRFDGLKKDAKPAALAEAVFYSGEHALQAALNVAEATVYGMDICKNLGNAPGNVCTPKYLADTARREAEAVGGQAKIMDAEAIQKLGMGSFWSVAKASSEGAYLIELRYNGAADVDAAPVVLVGKGITFDTGGISLKPGEAMDEMKYDMCGAASVIGTFCAAAKLKLPINLVAVVPTCENMPAGNASKPGDVVTSMKGLTIEVLNTDAEGRLILCDALTYAEQFKPRAVIDVATLTGACIIALGHTASGVLGNNQALVDSLLASSRAVNDKAWQLPLFDEYKEQLKSNFADLQNIGGRPAGTITAAVFLSYFTEAYPWAHLDIAGTAWKSGKDKGATGRPVPLLLNYLRSQAQQG